MHCKMAGWLKDCCGAAGCREAGRIRHTSSGGGRAFQTKGHGLNSANRRRKPPPPPPGAPAPAGWAPQTHQKRTTDGRPFAPNASQRAHQGAQEPLKASKMPSYAQVGPTWPPSCHLGAILEPKCLQLRTLGPSKVRFSLQRGAKITK